MREILYRGKVIRDVDYPDCISCASYKQGQWVEGGYAQDYYIMADYEDNLVRVPVDPKTAGQFICKVRNNSIYEFSRVKVDNSAISDKPIQSWGTVQWCDDLSMGYPGYVIILDDGSIFKEWMCIVEVKND